MPLKARPEHPTASDFQLLAAFHQLSPNPIVAVDANGNATFANDAAKRALGPLGPDASPAAFFPKDMDTILAHLRRRESAALRRNVAVGDCLFEENILVRPDRNSVFIHATDITELRRIDQELRQQDAFLKALVESPTDIHVFALDRNCCYTAFNTAHRQEMKRLYGTDIQPGTNLLDLITGPEVRSRMQQTIAQALAGESFTTVELDSDLDTWHEFNWSPIRTPEGGVQGAVAFVRDITRRKRVETALADSELKYRSLFESSNDALMLLDTERFFDCNEATLRVFGCSTRDEFLGKHPADVSPPRQADGRDSRLAANERIAAALQSGRNYFEWLHQRTDGTIFPADVLLTPVDFHGQRVLQATVRDISDRKRTESALTESEKRYRQLVADIGEGIGIGDADERFTFANPAAEELFGVSSGGLIGRCLLEFLDAEQTEVVGQQTAQRRVGELGSYELEITRPDRKKRIALVTASPRHDARGNVTGSFGIFRDITERRQAERQAEAERDRLRSILDAMPDGVYIVGQDWRLQYINPALLARGGPVNGRKCYEYFHGRSEPCPDCVNPHVFAGATTHREYTTRQDGVTYDIRDVAVTGDDGRPARLVFLRDITARKRMEAEVALRAELLAAANDLVIVHDLEGNIVYVNEAACRAHGYEREQMQQMNLRALVAPVQHEYALPHLKVLAAGNDVAFETIHCRQDGSEFPIEVRARVVESAGRRVVVSIVRDMADRKQAEAALRESESKYRHLFEESPSGIALLDAEGVVREANPRLLKLLGIDREDLVGRSFRQLLPAFGLDLTEQDADFRKRLAIEPAARELTFRNQDGGQTTIEVQSSVVGTPGNPAGVMFLITDATARKRAEERDRQHLHDTALLRDTALGFITLAPDADIHRYIAQRLAQLAGEAYIVVNSYDATQGEFRVRAIEGAGDSAQAALKLVGRPPDGMTFRLTPEELSNYAGGGLLKIDGGLPALSSGQLPAAVSDAIESVFVLGDTYVMSVYWQGKMLGTVYILMHKGVPMRDPAIVEAFVNQAAIAIQHRRDADELVRHREHLEELVRERTVELEAANRELEAFSYSVSHDLRAPLRAIDGFAQAVVEDAGPALTQPARGHLDRVSAAAGRMGELIDDLLNLARIARLPLERKEVDLSGLARSIAAELRRADPDRTAEFVIPDGLTVPADPGLVAMVLQNLLSNAWKFTSKHPTARIEFGIGHGGERTFFVRDDGAGFDMAYVDTLFVPFQRLHSGHEFPGSGVGLAIVQRIVRRHGGRVWFEAEVERGATCWFTLEPAMKEEERGRKT